MELIESNKITREQREKFNKLSEKQKLLEKKRLAEGTHKWVRIEKGWKLTKVVQ